MKKSSISWLLESNRWKHLVGILVLSLLGTFLMGVGCIGGMEFKDVHHANGDSKPMREWDWSAWDWLDVVAGMVGAVVGGGVNALVLWLLFAV